MSTDQTTASGLWEAMEVAEASMGFRGSSGVAFQHGVQWLIDHLRSTPQIEHAARALNAHGWTCGGGSDEPGRYDECEECRRVCLRAARVAVQAAIDER